MAQDPAADIRDGVRKLYEGSPIGRIGSAMDTIGAKTLELAGRAKRAVEETAQGTMRMVSPKTEPEATTPAPVTGTQPAATPQGTMRGTAQKRMTDIPLEKRLKKVSVSPTDNGGFIVSHHYHPNNGRGTPAPERHAFTSYDDVNAHLEKLGAPAEEK